MGRGKFTTSLWVRRKGVGSLCSWRNLFCACKSFGSGAVFLAALLKARENSACRIAWLFWMPPTFSTTLKPIITAVQLYGSNAKDKCFNHQHVSKHKASKRGRPASKVAKWNVYDVTESKIQGFSQDSVSFERKTCFSADSDETASDLLLLKPHYNLIVP